MLVFFISFMVYLYTLFPGVAPYRDTGEMVSVAHTLGIAHPPGYPLYTLVSKLWLIILPFGNSGYMLNVLSALSGAAAAWLMYRIFIALRLGRVTAGFLALVFAFSYLQWYLSLVSEMYTLSTLFAAAVILLLILINGAGIDNSSGSRLPSAKKLLSLLAFIFGAGLGIRMDLLLIAPAVLLILLHKRKEFTLADIAVAGSLFIAGFAVFLYLPLRSSIVPFLDWNHPATLEKLWGTLARKTHGGTLDLVSAPYAAGANFASTFKFYFDHLFLGLAYIGVLAAAAGLVSLWKKEKMLASALFAGWLFSGPVFIYLANMPPNPHALAILEAHFLLPNLFIAVFMAQGFKSIFEYPGGKGAQAASAALCSLMLLAQFHSNIPELNKRGNFIAYDYALNILRSLPQNSILVMKKDVQLFALWNQQYAQGKRPDSAIISQGLSASPWYKRPFARLHPDVALGPLRTPEDWKTFAAQNPSKRIFFSQDAEYTRPQGLTERPQGLIIEVERGKSGPAETALLDAIYPYRGQYFYTAYREFFTPDLIEDYARARIALARVYTETGAIAPARRQFAAALAFQPHFPQVYNLLAYSYVQENKYDTAKKYYLLAVLQFEETLRRAAAYNTLENVKQSISKDTAEAYISLGVCAEKSGMDSESLSYYSQALSAHPGAVRAYFNRGVIFWKRGEWAGVIRELEQALRVDPGFREAAYYLELAKKKAGQ